VAQRLYFNPRLQLPAHHAGSHAPSKRRRIGSACACRQCTLHSANLLTSDESTMAKASVQTASMGLPIANRDCSSNWRQGEQYASRRPVAWRYYSVQPCRQTRIPSQHSEATSVLMRGRLAHSSHCQPVCGRSCRTLNVQLDRRHNTLTPSCSTHYPTGPSSPCYCTVHA
jgi:hypothetical protein